MVVLRRLLLEFGVVGDQAVKSKIKEIQISAQSAKLTLLGLNKQIGLLNQAKSFGSGVSGIGGIGSVLTSREQTQVQKLSEKLEKEKERKIKFESRSITLAEDQLMSINVLLPGIKSAIISQKKALEKKFDNLRLNQRDMEKSLGSVKSVIKDSNKVIDKALKKVPGKQFQLRDIKSGRFLTNEVSKGITKVTNEVKSNIGKLNKPLTDMGSSIGKFKKSVSKTEIDKFVDGMDKIKDIVEQIKSTEPPKTPIITVKDISPFDPTKGASGVKGGELFPRTGMIRPLTSKTRIRPRPELVKPSIPDIDDDSIESFERQIRELKQRGKDIQASTAPKLSKPKVSIVSKIPKVPSKQPKKPTYDDPTDVYSIMENMLNERERKQKIKQINDMRSIFEKEFKRIEDVKERGYAFKPMERIRDLEETIQEKIQIGTEKLKSKFGKIVSKLPGFESAAKFESRRAAKLKENILKKPKVQQDIKNYNITFKNTVIDSKQREKDIIDKINQTLKGL